MANLFFRLVLTAAFSAALSQADMVLSTTDIWLAGQPDGASVTGFFGSDTAPGNSPLLESVLGGQILTFSVSGSTSVDESCFAGPDGGCYPDETSFGTGPVNGIGSYQGPSDALIGVFLDSSVPSGSGGPASGDFTGTNNFASLSPELNQIFFIGDGLTGTGSGAAQDFIAPVGATRLYLAVADSVGSSWNNEGSLSVTMAVATPEPSAAPIAAFACLAIIAVRGRRLKTAWSTSKRA